eukprot:m.237677 g.237677  ORF g.237677 m.237677 type:complete len:318 (-) comp13180_c0_seq1:79-1032(-)
MCIERVHAKAAQADVQHTIPREAYVTNQRISSALNYRLSKEETGVFVFYAPSGYESTISTHLLHDLLERGVIEGVIPLNGYDFERFNPETVLHWVSSAAQCPQANLVGLSGLFGSQEHKTVIVIDQFEALFLATTVHNIQKLIHNVAMESVKSQHFVVLLLTQTEESCRMTLSWNGGQKIRPIFRGTDDPCRPSAWTRDELMLVVQRHLDDLKSFSVSDGDRSRLEILIQNSNITQVGEVYGPYNFLVDHCYADYHCGRAARNNKVAHPAQIDSDSLILAMNFVSALVVLLILVVILACIYRYRSSTSTGKRLIKTP